VVEVDQAHREPRALWPNREAGDVLDERQAVHPDRCLDVMLEPPHRLDRERHADARGEVGGPDAGSVDVRRSGDRATALESRRTHLRSVDVQAHDAIADDAGPEAAGLA
jgi:hypothetical protein